MTAFDHLVYGTPDLARTTTDLASQGIELSPGGAHAGLGTRNALADLGDGGYLEVIGPDLEQTGPPRLFGIDQLTAARTITWCIRVDDLDAAVEHARAGGYDPGEPLAMSRTRSDGVELNWRLAIPEPDAAAGLVPFLIEWGDTPHPSTTAARGTRLSSLRATHPDPDLIRARLGALGVTLDVSAGEVGLRAELITANGPLVLPCG
ncbi:VOC family protein [Actinokineospora sp. NBRC 105648]|uniref:VOC family protein n=1 Tax=Actinokineospora sp. NBRC 105648 TaxID=3032206 RepID=UPI0024A2072F|nr:VOC family protein [Actinokineospora sp. NBRC 105648]GLZ43651.1 hypothetical protein Acsp05_72750 [Actinokineospora sp. NBRC 105648]